MEEKMKLAIKDYIDDKHRDVALNITNIFIWGFGSGVVFAYTNLTPFLIGLVVGYAVAKKEFTIVDIYIVKIVSLLTSFRKENPQ